MRKKMFGCVELSSFGNHVFHHWANHIIDDAQKRIVERFAISPLCIRPSKPRVDQRQPMSVVFFYDGLP